MNNTLTATVILVFSIFGCIICSGGVLFEGSSPSVKVTCQEAGKSATGTIKGTYSAHIPDLDGWPCYSYDSSTGIAEVKVPYSFTVSGLNSASHMWFGKGAGYNQSYWWVKYGFDLVELPDGVSTRHYYSISQRVDSNVQCGHLFE